MKKLVLWGMLFWSAAAYATPAVECGPGGASITGTSASVVYVAWDDALVAVTRHPELAEGAADIILSPSEMCAAAGYVLPAPHPIDPEPGLGKGAVVTPVVRGPVVPGAATTTPFDRRPRLERPTTSKGPAASPAPAPEEPAPVRIEASDEPAPSPDERPAATPAGLSRQTLGGGCAQVPSAAPTGLGLLLIAAASALRRMRRGVR